MIYDLGKYSLDTEGDDFFIAESAIVLGKVKLNKDSSVWFGAVLRGDTELITVGQGSNIQDCAVLHTDPGFPLTIGQNVTVWQHATLHGCSSGDGSFVGITSVILIGAIATYFAEYIQKNKWIGYVGLFVILIVAMQLIIGGLDDYGVLQINETFKKYF